MLFRFILLMKNILFIIPYQTEITRNVIQPIGDLLSRLAGIFPPSVDNYVIYHALRLEPFIHKQFVCFLLCNHVLASYTFYECNL